MWLSDQMPRRWKWGLRRLPVLVSLLDASVISMTCADFPMCTWLRILYGDIFKTCLCTICVLWWHSLFPCSLCRWYCVCLPWAVPLVLGLVDSLLSSSAPPLTGSILGPQRLCSRSATGSSKRLKALRSDLWNQVLYLAISHATQFLN